MDVQVYSPPDTTFQSALVEIQKLQDALRALRREEEHRIMIDKGVESSVLLAAALTALVEQKRREGYLITIPDSLARAVSLLQLDQKQTASDALVVPLNMRADVGNAVLYIVGELTDNIREHAHTTFGTVAVQSSKENIAIAVVDTGISIPAAYREAAIAIKDDCEAVTKALAGVSTKTVEERGTGLPSVKRLALEAFGGEMGILSAGAAFFSFPTSLDCKATPTYWQGTAVALALPIPPSELDFYKYVR